MEIISEIIQTIFTQLLSVNMAEHFNSNVAVFSVLMSLQCMGTKTYKQSGNSRNSTPKTAAGIRKLQ